MRISKRNVTAKYAVVRGVVCNTRNVFIGIDWIAAADNDFEVELKPAINFRGIFMC